MRGGGLAVETEEPAPGGLVGGAALQEREEVPTAVLGIDHRLARLGDVVVGALAGEADVGDQLAVVGDADGRPQGAAAEPVGDLAGS